MFTFRSHRFLKPLHSSHLRYASNYRSFSSLTTPPLTLKDVSKQIVYKFHPIVVDNFIKTLHTIFKSTKHYALVLSSVHFRAGTEFRCLLDWFNLILTSNEIVGVRVEREGTQRDSLKSKLTLAYSNYWKYKNSTETDKGEAVMNKIKDPNLEAIVNDLVDHAPFDVTIDITNSLRLVTNTPARGKSKAKIIDPEEVNKFFLKLIQTHRSHLPHFYPFLELLNIPPPVKSDAKFILTDLESSNERLVDTLHGLLSRAVQNLPKVNQKTKRNTSTNHCVHMRIRQAKGPTDYRKSKSQSFSPSTRQSEETSLLDSEEISELNSSLSEFEDDLNSDIDEFRHGLQEIQSLQSVAQFISDSRQNIYENISPEMLAAASPEHKILIDNLPPRLSDEEFQKIFHRLDGGPLFYHIYTSRLFEVGQHQMLPSDISDLNKGAKRWSQVRKAIRSDSYAFVVLSPEGYAKATRDDLQLFGCSVKGYRCRIRKTHRLKSLIVEVLHGLPVGQFVDLLSLCFAGEYEITYDSSLQDDRVEYVRLHFSSHEMAWQAATKFEVMLAEMSSPFFSFDWIKTTWFYESANKAKEKKRMLTLKDEENETIEDSSNTDAADARRSEKEREEMNV